MLCMDQRTPEDLDAVALGLRRGPRGAVALVLLATIAVVGAALATRVPADAAAPVAEEVVETPPPPAPLKSKAVTKRSRSTSRVAPVTPAPKPVVVEQPKPKEEPAVVVAEPAPEPLAPPPAPAPEPEEEVAAPAPAAVTAPAETPIEVDGNGAAIARLIADSKRAAVRACFESELKQTPRLRGTVVVELDLAPPNKVNEVRVSDDLERPAFTRCVRATMQTIRFTGLDEELSVSVPYNLTPQSK